MKATIITIGDEILIGQILDTNTQFISQALNKIGVVVAEEISIGDSESQITQTLKHSLANSQIVIFTGGLGPTKDDITKFTLAKYFNSSLHYDTAVAEHVKRLMAARGIDFNKLNQGQAMVPDCCKVLFNDHGTAPGMWFETGDKVVISLPGVPFEMKHLIEDKVIPALKNRYTLSAIVHRTLITSGIAESMLATKIADWENNLPSYLHLAYLPAPNIVRLRLSAYEVDGVAVAEQIEEQFETLRTIIPNNIVGYEGATVEQIVHNNLSKRGQTLAVAESCTGGKIASLFTAMAGASNYFKAGVVSYSNEAKINILGVKAESINEYGAVSESVAKQMAEGVRRVANADYGISTTGIAGPTGGSAEKPIGTVWFGISSKNGTYAVMKNCGTDRSQIISRAAAYAISLLKEELDK